MYGSRKNPGEIDRNSGIQVDSQGRIPERNSRILKIRKPKESPGGIQKGISKQMA